MVFLLSAICLCFLEYFPELWAYKLCWKECFKVFLLWKVPRQVLYRRKKNTQGLPGVEKWPLLPGFNKTQTKQYVTLTSWYTITTAELSVFVLGQNPNPSGAACWAASRTGKEEKCSGRFLQHKPNFSWQLDLTMDATWTKGHPYGFSV